jgi:hypothetical protein
MPGGKGDLKVRTRKYALAVYFILYPFSLILFGLRRALPLFDIYFPAFGLRQIEGVAFGISEADFRVGPGRRTRGDL